jgi:protein-S-isoprenylcysteine O-methyltransferase Ste14
MIYVIVQFTLIFLLGLGAHLSSLGRVSLVLILLALLIGVWAIFTVGLSKVSIFPDLRKGAKLVTHGPYKIVRHPMYTSVMLFCAGLVLSNPAWYMLLGFVALLADLVFKLKYEENKLMQEFTEYKKYKSVSYYFIPFIY